MSILFNLWRSLFFPPLQSYYFERDDVALPGFVKFFRKFAAEELEHAQALMHYQNERGGRIVLQDIKKPAKDEWGSSLEAMQGALDLEKAMNQSLLDLRKLADSHGDFNVSWLLLYTTLINISPIPLSLSVFFNPSILSSCLSPSLSSLPSLLLSPPPDGRLPREHLPH